MFLYTLEMFLSTHAKAYFYSKISSLRLFSAIAPVCQHYRRQEGQHLEKQIIGDVTDHAVGHVVGSTENLRILPLVKFNNVGM